MKDENSMSHNSYKKTKNNTSTTIASKQKDNSDEENTNIPDSIKEGSSKHIRDFISKANTNFIEFNRISVFALENSKFIIL